MIDRGGSQIIREGQPEKERRIRAIRHGEGKKVTRQATELFKRRY